MENTAGSQPWAFDSEIEASFQAAEDDPVERNLTPSGIGPLDERLGGLQSGGTYLFTGPPGPAKLVAVYQFLHAGLAAGERGLILTDSGLRATLDLARAWGFDLDGPWREGRLEILGFREDFEMRVLRSTEPEETLEELSRIAPLDMARIVVDPGSLFLQGGARTFLGRAFLDWSMRHPATVCATLAVDSAGSLPSSAEWLVHATSGVFMVERRSGNLYEIRVNRALPNSAGGEDPVTVQLAPGKGLVTPDRFPSRRRSDRPTGKAENLLVVTLGKAGPADLRVWVERNFTTEVVAEPLDAVSRMQGGASFGGVLVYTSREEIQDAVRACRAIRPLTGAAIVVASDDAVRSTDRVQILEAGADDCLSGGIDFRELATRIQQAVAAGGKVVLPLGPEELKVAGPAGGLVPLEQMVGEAGRRAGDPELSVFCLVRMTSKDLPLADLEKALKEEVRDQEGDLVASASDGCFVLLQGARKDPALAFLSRFASGLRRSIGRDPRLSFDVISHPGERDRLKSVLEGMMGVADRGSIARTSGGSRG
jgi:KaiC/GvpD/RAD55 family RecA-like ATPase/CheY-like chemotaxis protein